MDHHCPWVNNCIGFYNRKFFMQLLFYVTLIAYYYVISLFSEIVTIGMEMITERLKYKDLFRAGLILSAYGTMLVISFLITFFFKFHIKLVYNNSTTIESIDKTGSESYKKVIII